MTFQTKAGTVQLSQPRRRRRDQESIPHDQGGDGATFQTKAENRTELESSCVCSNNPSPPWSRGIDSWLRRLRVGLERRAVSAFVWKVLPSPPWSREIDS